MVTPPSVALLLLKTGLASVLSSVPLLMEPDRELKPPVPNRPALPTLSVAPVLSSVPPKFSVVPAVRLLKRPPRLLPKPPVVPLTLRLSVPLASAMLPLLTMAV